MITGISRRIEIDCGHRVPASGKCCHIHGHRYIIELTCTGTIIDSGEQDGMLLDFGFLKKMMEFELNDSDHKLILGLSDEIKPDFDDSTRFVKNEIDYVIVYSQKLNSLIYFIAGVPTVENLAKHWLLRLNNRFNISTDPYIVKARENGLRLSQIKVWETPNCFSIVKFNAGESKCKD